MAIQSTQLPMYTKHTLFFFIYEKQNKAKQKKKKNKNKNMLNKAKHKN